MLGLVVNCLLMITGEVGATFSVLCSCVICFYRFVFIVDVYIS